MTWSGAIEGGACDGLAGQVHKINDLVFVVCASCALVVPLLRFGGTSQSAENWTESLRWRWMLDRVPPDGKVGNYQRRDMCNNAEQQPQCSQEYPVPAHCNLPTGSAGDASTQP